jgi:hypothetical protein
MQQIDLSALIPYAIGLAVMFFGYFFGLFEGRGQGYKRRKKEEEEERKTKPAFEAPPPSPGSQPDNSLLKLGLDDKSQFMLSLDGQAVDTSQLAPDQRKRLIELMVRMRPWVEGDIARKPAADSQPVPRPMAAPTPSLSRLPQSQPSTASPSQPVPAAAAQPVKEQAAPTSMVGQIDAILQRHLAGSPLASLGLRLIESPEGGVIVMVGTSRYAGVGEVPNPEVQAAIRAAIAEWERKYTPGG